MSYKPASSNSVITSIYCYEILNLSKDLCEFEEVQVITWSHLPSKPSPHILTIQQKMECADNEISSKNSEPRWLNLELRAVHGCMLNNDQSIGILQRPSFLYHQHSAAWSTDFCHQLTAATAAPISCRTARRGTGFWRLTLERKQRRRYQQLLQLAGDICLSILVLNLKTHYHWITNKDHNPTIGIGAGL